MTVFEAKRYAEQEYAKKVSPNDVSRSTEYVVVSDKEQCAMVVKNLELARNSNCKWIFSASVRNCKIIVDLIES